MTDIHQNQTAAPRRMLFFGFSGVLLLDITGPAQVFGSANTLLGWQAYEMDIVTADGTNPVSDTGLSLEARHSFETVNTWDDVIIPGGPGVDMLLTDVRVLTFLHRINSAAKRVISICSGSLLTAATGALDGRLATSHWDRTALMSQHFPNVRWQADQIFTQDGRFYCSAGVSAGIDLALALVEADHGRALAADVAREMVVYLRRDGGQSQYSKPLQLQSVKAHRLGSLYNAIQDDPTQDWSIAKMAERAAMTERSLHRHFLRDLAMPPSHFVEEQRLGLARHLLERSATSLKNVARLSGFKDEQTLRRVFHKRLGVQPSTYRARFGSAL